jgi:BirA family transcriptional regulator, biotin operon repressor / biotin---[acetyl-CoA-carboxylase] ligase
MFELENFDIKLETDFIGRNFIYCDEIESTNTELLAGKQQYKKTGTVLLAEKQLAGKGRKDRTWQSARGLNLTFSILLMKDVLSGININHLNLAASLAVASAIENLHQLKTELKWPNDVLIDKKKVSGILTETSIKGTKIERVVIGIGINLNQIVFQGEFNFPPTSLKLKLGNNIEREIILAEILNIFEGLLLELESKPKAILKEWCAKCQMIGDKITITENDEVKSGIFHDIDENGYLLLKRKDSIEKIHFGDVSFV